MEDDLIRRVAVLKLIEDIKCNPEVPKNYGTLLDIMRAVREIPAAYDVDKVVERLEKDTELAYNRYMDCPPNAPQSVVARYSAQYQERAHCLEIVKSGGID